MKNRAFPWTLAFALLAALDAAPGAATARAQAELWNWGELAYARTYDTKLEVPNACPCSVEVTITKTWMQHPPLNPLPSPPRTLVPGNPYLTIAEKVIIPPGGGSVPARITTPNPPTIPRTPAGVALNDLTLIEGQLRLDGKPLPDCCNPKNCIAYKKYDIYGHVHLSAGGGGGGGGSGREPVDCDGYWEDGEEPPESVEEHCRDRLRQLAQHYVDVLLEEERAEDPAAWSWLPSADEIGSMSTSELLAMKSRAEGVRGGTTAANHTGAPPSR